MELEFIELEFHLKRHYRAWNGNRLGLGRVFSYPDPTHELEPAARTQPVYQTVFFFRGLDPLHRAPFRPTRFRPIRGPNHGPTEEKKKKKKELKPKQSPNENLITV